MAKKKTEVKEEITQGNILGKIDESLGKVLGKLEKQEEKMKVMEMEINSMKGGIDNRFKLEAKTEDIEKAREEKSDLDPRIVKIVDEMLGEDFRVKLERGDGPGYLLTIIVPERLSLLDEMERPIRDEEGNYKKDKNGNMIMEKYFPDDRRSKQISTADSFEVIKQHCERVRANIVATYQKLNKPLPEFKLKSY